jgi:polyribonucleotide nucleotidyltransferase
MKKVMVFALTALCISAHVHAQVDTTKKNPTKTDTTKKPPVDSTKTQQQSISFGIKPAHSVSASIFERTHPEMTIQRKSGSVAIKSEVASA